METPEQCVKYVQSQQKTLERRHRPGYGFFIVNFKQMPHIVLVFLLLTLSK